jgi:Ulp1 family protease
VESVTTPQQKNVSDSPMFMLKFLEYVALGKPFDFTVKDIGYYRKLMVLQLKNNSIFI